VADCNDICLSDFVLMILERMPCFNLLSCTFHSTSSRNCYNS